MDDTFPQNQTALTRPVRQFSQQEERKERIKIWMGWALIITALCVDLIELLGGYISFELIGTFAGFIASFVFWVWFLILGVPYSSNTKRFAMALITNVGEVIPGLDAIPFWFLWTAGMIIIVGMVRMEDKGENPTILGGIREGLTVLSVSNPVTFVALTIMNKTRRFVKKSVGIGQADWVKQNGKTHNIMPDLGKLQQIKNKYQARPSQPVGKIGNNVLNLKNKAVPTSNKSPNNVLPPHSKAIDDWAEATRRFNEMQNEQLVEKYYTGGMAKWKQDEIKYKENEARGKEHQKRLKDSGLLGGWS
jgi:hypothetical protein